ncbi:hypothetical protein IT415_01985 [bacterium]|nr:hypothetical protein [bacterium]
MRTDKPEAELYLIDNAGHGVSKHTWEAHRQLAGTLVSTVQSFLHANDLEASKLTGLVIFTGSGSFTGLRIGTTVANTLAYAHALPIASGEGDDWLADGLKRLQAAQPGQYATPKYGKEPNITKSKA